MFSLKNMCAFTVLDDPDQNGQNGFNATGVDIKYDSGIFMNHHQNFICSYLHSKP